MKKKTRIRTFVVDHRRDMLAGVEGKARRKTIPARGDAKVPAVYVVRFDARERDDVFRKFEQDVNAVILNADAGDRVFLTIHSPGGAVTSYANAANHVARLRAAGLSVTGFVDEMAASGGYMMACACNEIRANPLAFVGSIGVVAQMPIVSDGLARLGVDVRVYTAGDMKRTVTPFDKPDAEKEKAFEEKLLQIHGAFKAHVRQTRPDVGDDLMNGDFFMAKDVVGRLVDAVGDHNTALLAAFSEGARIRRVYSEVSRSFSLKRLVGLDAAIERVAERFLDRLFEARGVPDIR